MFNFSLGVVKTEATYVPVDHRYPTIRKIHHKRQQSKIYLNNKIYKRTK